MIYNSEGKEKCICRKSMGEHQKMHHHVCEIPKNKRDDEKNPCPDRVKGFNLCKKREELRCFKHCEPISQPCDGLFYNYFTSRTNYDFSGLIVVTNTGNTSGCSMQVRVTDRAGTAEIVATVSPGASVPIFVEGLISLDIACIESGAAVPATTCNGEVIFDLEYCATKMCL